MIYLNPPQQALVLCIDEKSQIQALDRTQPGLPIKKGRCSTMTHDYKRNGTTTLFAALDVLQGRVVTPTGLHLVLDNYGTRKRPGVTAWLERHPRIVPHFIPTSSSWLNLVERWFGELTCKRIRRGSFVSVHDLERAIDEFLQAWNEQAQALRVDRDDRVDLPRVVAMQADPRAHTTRLHPAALPGNQNEDVQFILGHYTRVPSSPPVRRAPSPCRRAAARAPPAIPIRD